MSVFASILHMTYKLSGAKKAFALPEDTLQKEIEKQNRHRGVFTPTDRKAYYETITAVSYTHLDVYKRQAYGVQLVLLGLESQEHIHYAMPLRVMGYDYATYKKQYNNCLLYTSRCV